MNNQSIKEIFETNHKIISNTKPNIDGLFAGKLGLSYYYSLLHQVSGFDESDSKNTAVELLEEVLDDFYSSKSTLLKASYTGGASGLGYTICSLNRIFSLGLDIESDLSDLDEYLFNSALELIEYDNTDCLHGAGGILFYFTVRGNVSYLNKLVPIIISRAIVTNNGIWFKNNFLDASQANIANLSLSHGMTGLLIILLKTCDYLSDENFYLVQKTVKDGIKFINTYYLPIDLKNGRNSFYPSVVNAENNEYSHACRLAWCYGDLGIVLLFYQAGRLLNDPELTSRADEIGVQSLLRKAYEDTGIDGPFFCHGSGGLSSFYFKLYLESGNEKYLEGMEFWMKETANFFLNDNGTFCNNPLELLDGLIGVNISILEYLNRDKSLPLSNIFLL